MMQAFATKWDERDGWNKLGSDGTLVIKFGGGTLMGLYRKIMRECAPDQEWRVEVFHSDRIYGEPDAVEYMVDGKILSAAVKGAYKRAF